jgi:hypothetical protein
MMPDWSAAAYDAALLTLRPPVAAELAPEAAATPDDFQHRTLRPVLKQLNGHLLRLVADTSRDYRLPLATASAADQQRLLQELLQRNSRLQHTITGMATGLLTASEYAYYRRHRPELNRRLLQLVQQRVLTQLADVVILATTPDNA